MTFNKDEFLELCKTIGSNPHLVQGGGGNTSYKEENSLVVKASGKWLANALEEDMFVSLDLNAINSNFDKNPDFDLALLTVGDSLRPSIETSLHALMPHKVVIHIHSVNAISHSIYENSESKLQKLLLGLNWAWVPYNKPGTKLTAAVRETFKNASPDILVLGNHGLVLGGESLVDVENLLETVEDKLDAKSRITTYTDDYSELAQSGKNVGYKLPVNDDVHFIAKDKIATEIALSGNLYPDHVVYLGNTVCLAESLIELDSAIDKFKAKHNVKPNYIIVRDKGILVLDELQLAAHEMLLCLSLVLSKVNENNNVRYLTDSEEDELLNWEAEAYRKKLDKQVN